MMKTGRPRPLGTYRQHAIALPALVVILLTGFSEPARAQSLAALERQLDQLSSQENYEAAIPIAKQIADAKTRTLGERHRDTLSAMNNYGYYLKKNGDLQAAQPVMERTLQLRLQTLGASHDQTLISYNNLISLLDDQGNVDAAVPLQAQYVEIQKRNIGGQNHEIGAEINYLGQLYKRQGKFVEARDQFSEALQIFQNLHGERDTWTAITRSNLGLVLYELGEYSQALAHVERSLPVFREKLGENHEYTASTYQSVGYMLELQGNTEEARSYYEKSLRIRTDIFGEDHLDTAYSYNNLALLLDGEGEDEAANGYYLKALEIFQRELGEDDPLTATVTANYGDSLVDQDRFEEAATYLQQALAVNESIFGEENPRTAGARRKLARLHYKQRNYDQARAHYQKALATSARLLGKSHPDCTECQIKLALIDAAEGNWEASLEQADNNFRNVHDHIRNVLVGLTSTEQLNYLSLQSADWERGLSYALADTQLPHATELTATWLLNTKGTAQETMAVQEKLARASSDPKLAQLKRQLDDTRQELASLALATNASDKQAQSEALARLQQEEKRLSRQIVRELGPRADQSPWIEIDQLRSVLPADEVLVSFARFHPFQFQAGPDDYHWKPHRYVAWVIPAEDSGPIQVIDLGLAEEIDAQIAKIRKQLEAAGKSEGAIAQNGEQEAEAQYRQDFEALSNALWRPLAEKLPEDTQKLILCPDGALWLVPWSAIPQGEKYLLEEYSIRYVVSGRELLAPETTKATNAPLLFADPDYDLSPEKLWASLRAIFRNLPVTPNTTRSLISQTSPRKVAPLPGTRIEAQAIAPSMKQIFDKEPIQYLGQYAQEGVLKRVQRPQTMVISTHGFFLPEQSVSLEQEKMPIVDNRAAQIASVEGKPIENPLLRCGLLLAGCNRPSTGGEDGVLTGMEIVGINLQGTELVVLSACETGVGEIKSGEGVAGLRQAFQLAGAKGVVSTLWSIPDRDSALIMIVFFQQLAQGNDKALALRNAQLERIASRRERYGAAHPYFWAAWTMTGK